MGCCASRLSDDGAPAVRAHSSSRNITAPSTRPSSVHSPRASHASQGNTNPSQHPQDANDRPNTLLKPIPAGQRSRPPNTLAAPTATGRGRVKPLTDATNLTWTRSRLEKERVDWWDTRVTGSAEIWGAIRLAAQHLQAGELQEAQTMLDVTSCTCPTGLLWKGVYDATGVQYKVPEWVVVEPEGLVDAKDVQDEAAIGPASASTQKDCPRGPDDDSLDGIAHVRVRLSHNQRDILLEIRRQDPIALAVEKLKTQAKIDADFKVRLAYGGHVYQDHEVLESQPYWDFANNFVLTALIFQ